MAGKYLAKFRPGFVEAAEAKDGGSGSEVANSATAIAT